MDGFRLTAKHVNNRTKCKSTDSEICDRSGASGIPRDSMELANGVSAQVFTAKQILERLKYHTETCSDGGDIEDDMFSVDTLTQEDRASRGKLETNFMTPGDSVSTLVEDTESNDISAEAEIAKLAILKSSFKKPGSFKKRRVVFDLSKNQRFPLSSECRCVPTATHLIACKEHGRPFLISYLDHLFVQ